MMMPNAMMGGNMMQATGMDMMQSSGMDMSTIQQSMDMSGMTTAHVPPLQPPPQPMDMGLMGGVMMDPSMMAMYSTVGTEGAQEQKEIVLKHCKLTPPSGGTPQPPRRAKPPGCKTIFVGGLPDKIRESTVREIFERFGRIHILRLSKKNFCHIRFDSENCVDAAMAISGYRIKLLPRDKDEKEDDDDSQATNGWLHVDYALVRTLKTRKKLKSCWF